MSALRPADFSEVLLLRGAKCVYAVDVGHGQLHPSLLARSEIVSLEKTDIRSLEPSNFVEQPDLATVDVSFISLKLVLPAVSKLLRPTATIVALIKPQFEVQRRNAKKGIVRSELARTAACQEIATSFGSQGWRVTKPISFPDSRRRRQHRIFYWGRAWLSAWSSTVSGTSAMESPRTAAAPFTFRAHCRAKP